MQLAPAFLWARRLAQPFWGGAGPMALVPAPCAVTLEMAQGWPELPHGTGRIQRCWSGRSWCITHAPWKPSCGWNHIDRAAQTFQTPSRMEKVKRKHVSDCTVLFM